MQEDTKVEGHCQLRQQGNPGEPGHWAPRPAEEAIWAGQRILVLPIQWGLQGALQSPLGTEGTWSLTPCRVPTRQWQALCSMFHVGQPGRKLLLECILDF